MPVGSCHFFLKICYVSIILLTVSSEKWYLSGAGDDAVHCGETRATACQTLSWLLTLAHRKNHFPSFHVITDIDLIFDQPILVNYYLSILI